VTRKPRSDGLRNRAQIVARTAVLFHQQGVEVPMGEIAAYAGVGTGTLYRHFPDRSSLTQAVALYLYEQIAGLVQQAQDAPDAWQALTRVTRGWVSLRLAVRKPLDAWLVEARKASPRLSELHELIVGFLDRNVAEAQAAGTLRADVTRNDLIRLIGLLVLAEDRADQLTDIVIDGLRGPSQLPEVPMKAAVLNEFGAPLSVQALPDPVLGTGEVIVDVAATRVIGYAAGVLSGARNYLLELPVVPGPGGIGRVRATGPDATRLSVGDWVYIDPTLRSRDDAVWPDTALQGWTYRSPAAIGLHRFYHHGSFAEQTLVPTENVTPIGDIDPADAGRWCALGHLLVPYGGLLAIGLLAGETLVVNGATGGFGSAAVAAGLAMGAARVVATGRNQRALDELARRLGPRVHPVPMTGDEADDRDRISAAAEGPVDCVLDLLPRMASVSQVLAAVRAVRPGGRVVLMGGVGRTDGAELTLPYNWLMHNNITVRGQWMYPRDATARMVQLVRAGLVDLSQFELTEFGLDDVNQAISHAAEEAGPLRLTVLRP
jgi:alcohol dehydrogenase